MHLSNIAAIAADHVVTVGCYFTDNAADKKYTFKCHTDLANTLKIGDKVIADTKTGLRVVTVARIDDVCDIMPNDPVEYAWVFQRVDTSLLDNLNIMEDRIVKVLKKQQRDRIRTKVLDELGLAEFQTLIEEAAKPISVTTNQDNKSQVGG